MNICSSVAADGSRLVESRIQVRILVLSTRYLYRNKICLDYPSVYCPPATICSSSWSDLLVIVFSIDSVFIKIGVLEMINFTCRLTDVSPCGSSADCCFADFLPNLRLILLSPVLHNLNSFFLCFSVMHMWMPTQHLTILGPVCVLHTCAVVEGTILISPKMYISSLVALWRFKDQNVSVHRNLLLC